MTTRRRLLAGFSGVSSLLYAAGLRYRALFAMDTALVKNFGTLITEADVRLLRHLGYQGIGPLASSPETWSHLVDHLIPWLRANRLGLPAVYSWCRITRDQFTVDPGIAAHIAALRGLHTTIWLPVNSSHFKPSDTNGDRLAVTAIREVADLSAQHGSTVTLYPHFGSWIEKVDDALRVAHLCQRKNVGISFNLCHWLHTGGGGSARAILQRAAPLLSTVTINGANRDGHSWPELIQPLDQGTFDVRNFLRELQAVGYRGPIGLQGYDVAKTFHIEPSENLSWSMQAWHRLIG